MDNTKVVRSGEQVNKFVVNGIFRDEPAKTG